jgi:AdoMet-dependent rRNA methyltransferase SPB1
VQLERLNSEAAARSKRQRRHANEQKQRTIQRMQLRMVAPLDIGLEQADAQLGVGQDDVFDLGEAERGLRRAGGARQLADAELPDGDDGEAAAPAHAEEEDEEGLDSEEERERRLQGLEGELDGLYDAYRTKLAERDAKFRVKEARKKNALRSEEWGGVKGKGSDDDGSDGDSDAETDGEGGWDVVARRKAAEGEDSSDDDSDAEPVLPRKRRRLANGKALETGLVTSLEAPKPKAESSRAAQLWFSQDVFAGVPALDELEDEDDEDESQSSMEEDEQVPQSDADVRAILRLPVQC